MKNETKKQIAYMLRVDPRITAFQKKVYTAILDIPKGETRTYSWVAKRIGKPKAIRAVGQALKKNKYLSIVPCHRVIRADGRIGGYVKGPEQKKKLLEKEGYLLI